MNTIKNTGVKTSNRVGIFRGTFDPMHAGHLAFAKQAMKVAKLTSVYFLIERSPSHKNKVSAYAMRAEDVVRALDHEANIHILEGSDFSGSISKILPSLRSNFRDSQLVFLMGSDVAKTLPLWRDLSELCRDNEIVVGLRENDSRVDIEKTIRDLKYTPRNLVITDVPRPHAASSKIRQKS